MPNAWCAVTGETLPLQSPAPRPRLAGTPDLHRLACALFTSLSRQAPTATQEIDI
jgi:hypothetical protein